jgi:hypothetical protein
LFDFFIFGTLNKVSHDLSILLIAAWIRDFDNLERKTEVFRLLFQELEPDSVHGDPVEFAVHRAE